MIWWKVNSPRFPILSQLARDVLAIPMSSVASECAFSTGGRILDPFRSSLTPKCVQCLICFQDWLKQETKPICVEESLEFLEKIELGKTFYLFLEKIKYLLCCILYDIFDFLIYRDGK